MAFPASTTTRPSTTSTRPRLEAGYTRQRAPRRAADYHPGYYSAYVLDPDGNNIEVVNHNR